jgi:hypothetical protein
MGGRQFPLAPNEQAPEIREVAYAREGGFAGPVADYQDIGESLFRGLRVDYTYLHPEVLVSRCSIDNRKLILNNRENREEYSVLILAGGDTLSVAAAAKVKELYDKGGMVIATTALPTRSAEFGHDKKSAPSPTFWGHPRWRFVSAGCKARAGPAELSLVLRQEQ